MNLFEINKAIRAIDADIEDYAAENDGLISEESLKALNSIEGDREQKILDLSCWYKEILAEATAVDAEAKKLSARKKTLQNKADRIKAYINSGLNPDEKLKDSRVSISWRKSEAVDIDDEVFDINKVDDQFKKIKVEPNKTELKKALKNGVEIAGVDIITNKNLQIK